jgi:hypothetical protein
MTLVLALPVLGAGTTPDRDPAWSRLDDEEVRRVAAGQITVRLVPNGGTQRQTLVVGTVQAPAQEVFRVFSDLEHYAETFNLRSSHVTESQGQRHMVRCVLEMPWPVGDQWVMNETHLSPETLSLWFKMREGSIRAYGGTVRIVPRSAGSSDVYYAAHIDPGIPFLPDWFIELIQNYKLPDTIAAVRRAVRRR